MSAKPFVREMVGEAARSIKSPFTNDDIARWILARYPGTNRTTINCQITYCTVNQPARVNVAHNSEPRLAEDERYDFLYALDRDLREVYDPKRHGVWCIRKLENGDLTVARGASIALPPEGEPTSPVPAPRRKHSTTDRIAKRIAELSRTFSDCLDRFDAQPVFVGPQVHFHLRTLARLHHRGLAAILHDEDDVYWDYLYATLTAWGMNRLGSDSKTRLVDFEEYRDCIISHRDAIVELEPYEIIRLADAGEAQSVTARLQDLIGDLCVAVSPSKIVANSKALHHLLPKLVPPIDRRYTLRFFYDSVNPPGIANCFSEVFPPLVNIAVEHRQAILSRVGTGFNTSTSKVIDNAVVGFVMAWD
jgi:hypothetical protein